MAYVYSIVDGTHSRRNKIRVIICKDCYHQKRGFMKRKLKLFGIVAVVAMFGLSMTGCPPLGNNDGGTIFRHVSLDGMWSGTAPAIGVTMTVHGTGWAISGSMGSITFNDTGTFNRQGDSVSLHSLFGGHVGMAHIVGEDRFRLEIENGTFYFIRSTLADHLAWLRANAQSGGNHTITISRDESLTPSQGELPTDRNNLTITLRGDGRMRTVSLAENGSLFDVASGVTLVLDNNVTLRGRTGNDNSVVRVFADGTLVMNTGARITGNTETGNENTWGGGVMLWDGGTFTMNGGEISNNSANWGGGVQAQGTFNIHGGTISNNTSRSGGGGVNAARGVFVMHNGTISGNTVTSLSYGFAGGVFVGNGGTFAMHNGTIFANTATGHLVTSAGGVLVGDGGIFTMHNGRIFDNTAQSSDAGAWGGGVSVGGTFYMLGGEIFDNTATGATWGQAGGVLVGSHDGGLFNMRGGVISGNVTVSRGLNWANGGGVFVCGYNAAGGTFLMSGGVILYDNIIRHTGNMGGSNAALTVGIHGANSATAQFGTIIGNAFSRTGDLITTNNTVGVVNGVWQGLPTGREGSGD